MKKNFHLLVIDPQNDFCDLPASYLTLDPHSGQNIGPALPVPGAHADMQRVAQLISQGGTGLSEISVTLDSHHRYDIAHPVFWLDQEQQQVAPFTQISAEAVRQAQYQPRDMTALPRVLAYLDALEQAGRYQLMVWPIHCEIGTWGQAIHADVRAAYNQWEDKHCRPVQKILKGSNPWTEHYSAIMAEVPDDDAPDTQLNRQFIDIVKLADRVYIAGEASSHCVKATTEHLVAHLPSSSIAKLVLLTDCMSPVSGFETSHQKFIGDMQALGVQTATAADVLPDLLANGM